MRNIWKIFTTDIRRISNNVVAVVIIMGLSILPALYAWFNIFSNWDPYEPAATSQLKIRFVLYLLSMFFLRICIYCAFYRLFQYSYCIFSTASV